MVACDTVESKPKRGDATLDRIRQLADGWTTADAPDRPVAPRGSGRRAMREAAAPEGSPPVPRDEFGEPPALRGEPTGLSALLADLAAQPQALQSQPHQPQVAPSEARHPARAPAHDVSPTPRAFADLPALPELPRPATLRSAAQLPRYHGWFGDVRYVFTVSFGATRTRRELARLAAAKFQRNVARQRAFVALGSRAIASDANDPAIALARTATENAMAQARKAEQELRENEKARSAATAVLHEARSTAAADIATHRAQVVEYTAKLGPVEKEFNAARRAAADLKHEMARFEQRIAAAEVTLAAGRADPTARAKLQAECEQLRQQLAVVASEEAPIATKLDGLTPRVAGLQAELARATAAISAAQAKEQAANERAAEQLAALDAQKKVLTRAAAEATTVDTELREALGEHLWLDVQWHATMPELTELEIQGAEADRHEMELRELLATIDRWKLARGLAALLGFSALVAGGAVWWWLRR